MKVMNHSTKLNEFNRNLHQSSLKCVKHQRFLQKVQLNCEK